VGVEEGVLGAAGELDFVSLFPSLFVSLLAVLLASLDVESELVSLFDSDFLALPLEDEYRSEYHPPPLRMKLVPALMSRCAVGFPHLGQTSVAAAVMRCISSHSFPQALHPYS